MFRREGVNPWRQSHQKVAASPFHESRYIWKFPQNDVRNCSGPCTCVLRATCPATKVLSGRRFERGWKPILRSCRHSMPWKTPAVSRMLLGMMKRRASTYFTIVQRKVPKAAEVSVTTGSARKNEKSRVFIRPVTPSILRRPWVSNEDEYRDLQELGEFDTRTESWVKTPTDIRRLGGALFCDRRYGHVFVFHNSAPSFYASRGFRGSLRV